VTKGTPPKASKAASSGMSSSWLVGHQGDMGEAAPLQLAGEEPDALRPPAGVAHVDLPEVVLAKLRGHPSQRTNGAGGTARSRCTTS
jgi:phosphohistidine phosphatase SixA